MENRVQCLTTIVNKRNDEVPLPKLVGLREGNVNHPLADRSWRNLGGPVEVLINLFSQKTENL